LVIKPDGQLIIRAPKRVNKREINGLIEKHADWIVKKQAEVLEAQKKLAPHQFVEGEAFYFLGKTYQLRFTGAKKNLVRILS
jgi:predicted metal-dependent hydrolase